MYNKRKQSSFFTGSVGVFLFFGFSFLVMTLFGL